MTTHAPTKSTDGPSTAAVAADGITRRFGHGETAVDALRGISLDVVGGRLTAVMGPSGSGKSTLMHILAGLDRPTEGTVTIAGTDITELGDAQLTRLRREHIGFIFQSAARSPPSQESKPPVCGAIRRRPSARRPASRASTAISSATSTSSASVTVRPFDLDPLLGTIVISQASFDGAFPRASDLYTFVNVPAALASTADQAIEQGAERFPGVEVLSRAEFVDDRSEGIVQILNLLFVLLALSVVISLFGIVNTLLLTVFERTRELGMLRAVGMTRRQARRMVRHESVITALIGAAFGMPLGIILAGAVTGALAEYDIAFRIPVTTLAVFAGIAIAAGIVAAVLPARRASRLDVLEALQYE